MPHCPVEKCNKLASNPWLRDFIDYWTLLTAEFRLNQTNLCKILHCKCCLSFKSLCLCVSFLSAICHWLSLGGTSDVNVTGEVQVDHHVWVWELSHLWFKWWGAWVVFPARQTLTEIMVELSAICAISFVGWETQKAHPPPHLFSDIEAIPQWKLI